MRRLIRPPRIVTLCVHGRTAKPHDNAERIALLAHITHLLNEKQDWHPIDAVVLPGGFFRMAQAFGPSSYAERRSAVSSEQFAKAICTAVRALGKQSPGIRVVTGVLAASRDSTERTEQSSLAFSAGGLVAVARKIFPTAQDSRGGRYITPALFDYSSTHRFLDLAQGGVALLNACYDLFGVGDIGSDTPARRLAIRRLYLEKRTIVRGDQAFVVTRQKCLAAWVKLMEKRRPDVALATIHGFRQPGQDGYWQRHGIARASAALDGALVVGAAHFYDVLPREPHSSPLAAHGVGRDHLEAGLHRLAHPLHPIAAQLIEGPTGTKALLRLFTPPPAQAGTGGRFP